MSTSSAEAVSREAAELFRSGRDFVLEDMQLRRLRYHLLRLTTVGLTQVDVEDLGSLVASPSRTLMSSSSRRGSSSVPTPAPSRWQSRKSLSSPRAGTAPERGSWLARFSAHMQRFTTFRKRTNRQWLFSVQLVVRLPPRPCPSSSTRSIRWVWANTSACGTDFRSAPESAPLNHRAAGGERQDTAQRFPARQGWEPSVPGPKMSSRFDPLVVAPGHAGGGHSLPVPSRRPPRSASA